MTQGNTCNSNEFSYSRNLRKSHESHMNLVKRGLATSSQHPEDALCQTWNKALLLLSSAKTESGIRRLFKGPWRGLRRCPDFYIFSLACWAQG